MEKVKCPSCKGKGHVLDAVVLLNPILALLAIGERNDRYGMTRNRCGQCKGKGFVTW